MTSPTSDPPDPADGHARHDHGPHDPHQPGDGHDHGPLADVSVRSATAADADAVGAVQAAVWREAYGQVVPVEVLDAFAPESFAAAWRSSLQAPPGGAFALLVARDADTVVGFASVGPTQDPDADDTTGELMALAVTPEARRAGHGSRLVNAAVTHLLDAGATSVHAWLLASDEATRAFLVGAGFGPDGAFRDRVVGAGGETAREVRVVTDLGDPAPA